MDLGLTGKAAVVTGASRGIGLAVARAPADEGVRVVGGARMITPELDEAAVATVAADVRTAQAPWSRRPCRSWVASTSWSTT